MTDANDTWEVVKTERETPDVTSVVLKAPEGKVPEHTPGQFASLRVMTDQGWSKPHPFTISCAPCAADTEEGKLRFTIKNVDDFTGSVPDWQPGTKVQCAGPFGAFCKEIDQKQNIVMVAGGVGITPFLSVLRHFRRIKAHNRVLLIWANKTAADIFSLAEFTAMTRELNLQMILLLSREEPPKEADNASVRYEHGRVTAELLRRYVDFSTASFYLCGPAAMQDFVLNELSKCGVNPADVERESFGATAS